MGVLRVLGVCFRRCPYVRTRTHVLLPSANSRVGGKQNPQNPQNSGRPPARPQTPAPMSRKRHKPEEIVAKLRQVEVLVSQGQSVVDAVRSIRVTEVSSGTSF
jgi:putative transposase